MTIPDLAPDSPSPESSSSEPLLLEPVQGNDGVWLQDRSTNLMVINSVFTCERMDVETLRRLWTERVVEHVEPTGVQPYLRFRKRIVERGRRAYWQVDPDFSIDRHIVSVPPGRVTDSESLQHFIGEVAGQPLPADRPLWQFLHIHEYEEGASAVVVRVHHSIGDGLALLPVIFSFLDSDPESDPDGLLAASKESAQRVAKQRPSRLITHVLAPLAGPFVMLKKLLSVSDRHPLHGPEIGGEKRVAWTRRIDLDLVKAVKNGYGATVNDVLMTCVGGAFRRYLESIGGPVVETVRVSMPFNVRSLGDPPELNNRFAAVMMELPVAIAEPRKRLRATKAKLDALKRSVEPLVMYGAATVVLKVLPAGASRKLIDFLANKCTSVVTNVPGPHGPMSLGGRRVRSMMFWVPQRADIGIGISIFSFDGHVQVAAICDTDLVPDPRVLMSAFEDEFQTFHDHLKLAESG